MQRWSIAGIFASSFFRMFVAMAKISAQTIQKMTDFLTRGNFKGYEQVLEKIKVVGGGEGHCICVIPIEDRHRNRGGTLHGGMTATLVDVVSAAAVHSIDTSAHVQTANVNLLNNSHIPSNTAQCLDITYIKGAAIGDELVVDAKTIDYKHNIATLNVDVTSKRTGALIAKATHTRWKGTDCGGGMCFKTTRVLAEALKSISRGTSFENVLDKVRVIKGGSGKCVCEMTVDDSHRDNEGYLHSGLISTMIDSLSTAALITTGTGAAGVSVDMSISYLSQAKVGDDIVIDASTVKAGRTLAFLTVDITNKDTGVLVATGRHTKYVGSGKTPTETNSLSR